MNNEQPTDMLPMVSGAQKTDETGFTLVELMIALVLGLLVIAGVGSVFLANKDAYRTNEALSQVQDSARTAFEFLARDIREAGSNPCGSGEVQSTLNGGPQCGGTISLSDWVHDFDEPVTGTDDPSSISGLPGSGNGAPVSDSDAIRIGKAEDLGIRLDETSPAPAVQRLTLSASTTRIGEDDILLACEAAKATIFQVTSFDGNVTVDHDSSGGTIGNCSQSLNHPISSSGGNGTAFGTSSYLAVPRSVYWYVGANSAGSASLYRARTNSLDMDDLTDAVEVQEMVRGVEEIEIEYHESGADAFVDASNVGNWDDVDAVWLQLTVRSRGVSASDPNIGAGSDRQRLLKTFSTTVAIRNRLGG